MKLIDLLVKELPNRGGWPEGVADYKYYAGSAIAFDEYDREVHGFRLDIKISEKTASKVTRSQYEAAIASSDDRMEQDLNECIGQGVQWQGDGVPPVGCACEMQDSKGKWLPVDIIAKNDGFTFGWSYDYRIVLFGDKADEFRQIRTEAEKAREKLAASLHIAAGASPIELNGIGPLYFELADAIISGSVFGTTFKAGK